MQTWEVMQISGKKFRRKSDGLIIEIETDGTLNWESGYKHLSINDEWEEIKEPVDFMTAVKSGKKVKVKHPFISQPYERAQLTEDFQYLGAILDILSTAWNDDEMRKIILEGDWYIE